MTDQAIFLIIGLMAVIFFLSRARQAKTKGGKFIINDSASPLLGFTPVEPADRSEEEQLLEEQLGGQAFSRGRIRNYPATLLYDSNSGPRRKRHSGMDTARVTLVLSLATPAPLSFLIEPKLPLLLRRSAPKEPPVITGDAAFDERFQVYSGEGPDTLAFLTPPLREMMIALRREISPDLPDDGGGWKASASGLRMGKLRLKDQLLAFTINGSPNEETARQLQSAAVVLASFAEATPGRD